MGVTAENVDDVNEVVSGLTSSDVDTTEEIQKITDDLNVNILPTVDAGPDKMVEVNQAITITGSAVDTDGTIVSYQWTRDSTEVATTASFNYTPTSVGTDTLTLTVMDDDGATATDSMNVTVSAVPVPDTTPPVITVLGDNPQTVTQGDMYVESGATALDDKDGTIAFDTTGTVDTSTVGAYTITYTATDNANNTATETRTVNVILGADTVAPEITVNGSNPVTITQGNTYTDAGATATDDRDGSVTVTTTGTVNTSALGTYTITYTAADSANNTATATRTVNVVLSPDTTPPVITILGNNPETVIQGETYADAEATALDDRDGTVTVTTSGTVNTSTAGTYTITYTSTDSAGNSATAIRTVNVEPDASVVLNLPSEYFNYANIELPAHYTTNSFSSQSQFQRAAIEFDNTPADNPITDAGATLGRVLFYDKKLSANGTIACASCHQQEHGFSDPEILSEGFDGGNTRRHSMGLANARFFNSGKFFWDERAATLEEQVLMPFQDPVEMGLTLTQLEQIVSEQSYYPSLFRDTFGNDSITSDRISKALAQFIRSMVSITSKYDNARSKVQSPVVDFPDFTEEENLGKNLFFLPRVFDSGDRVGCASCHVTEAFSGPIPNNDAFRGTTESTSNGLDANPIDDLGIFETTGNIRDEGKFKAPSLKNISIRPPYMHDGRFATLEEVVEHYSAGIQNNPNLVPDFLLGSDGEPLNFNFTQEEKNAIIAFLNTLTDNEMLADEKYSDPFNQ